MALDVDLNDIDFSNAGNWPAAGKAAAIVLACAVLVGLWVYVDTLGQLDDLDRARDKESALKQEFEQKQAKAAALDSYKAQMTEMEESFGTMLRQLPSKTEVANLLVDITQTGLASGLTFELFQPRAEVPKEFYAELPISLRVNGNYHDFGQFVSGIAALPRIVTLHDIKITGSGGADGSLVMHATAKTYRYLDEEEIAANRKKNGRRRR